MLKNISRDAQEGLARQYKVASVDLSNRPKDLDRATEQMENVAETLARGRQPFMENCVYINNTAGTAGALSLVSFL